MDETTVGQAIPAANVVGLVRRLGLPEDDFPAKEVGVFRVTETLKDAGISNDFHKVIAYFVKQQREQRENPKVRSLVDAVVLNMTTKSDLTESDLDILSTIVKSGGTIQIVNPADAVGKDPTPGMARAIGNLRLTGRVKGQCTGCGFMVPSYPGRYPKKCPKCDQTLSLGQIEPALAWHDSPPARESLNSHIGFLKGLQEARDRAALLSRMTGGVADFYSNLTEAAAAEFSSATRRVFLGETRNGDAPVLTPTDIASLRRAVFYLEESDKKLWQPVFEEFCISFGLPKEAPRDVFFCLVDHLESKPDASEDAILSRLFDIHSVKPGMTERLRSEVAKRSSLTEAIRSCTSPSKFTLVKALSSCLTRAMIEGELKGGDEYQDVGSVLFAMMERAFNGDLEVPSRFLSLYFLKG